MFVELDTRRGDGLTVTLEWNRDTGQTQIVLHDIRADGLTAFGVLPANAADAFRHPFRHAPERWPPSRYTHRRRVPPAALRARARRSFLRAARASAHSRLGCSRRSTSRASRPIFWSARLSARSTLHSSHRGPSPRRQRGS